MNDSEEKEKDNEIRKRLTHLDRSLEKWKKENSTLTHERIDFLHTLASKNLWNLSNKQGLNDNQRGMKTNIQQHLRYSFSDIDQMIRLGFIGGHSLWNPHFFDSNIDREPYNPDSWREVFPIDSVCDFVRIMTRLYGDEYAIPIADAIKSGLEEREQGLHIEVDVPVTRRKKRGVF